MKWRSSVAKAAVANFCAYGHTVILANDRIVKHEDITVLDVLQ